MQSGVGLWCHYLFILHLIWMSGWVSLCRFVCEGGVWSFTWHGSELKTTLHSRFWIIHTFIMKSSRANHLETYGTITHILFNNLQMKSVCVCNLYYFIFKVIKIKWLLGKKKKKTLKDLKDILANIQVIIILDKPTGLPNIILSNYETLLSVYETYYTHYYETLLSVS